MVTPRVDASTPRRRLARRSAGLLLPPFLDNYPSLGGGVLLRYSIALGLMSYAVAKILPQQFPPIATAALEGRVGDLSPMGLLRTFMQYSRPCALFGGLMELLACVLLRVRRTATLGALVCLAVMTNVALLNYAYAVPVKLYATMITLSAAVLVLHDARRLLDLLVRDRPVGASTESTVLQDRVPAVWRRVLEGSPSAASRCRRSWRWPGR